MSQFGIYISCHRSDYRLTKGCCESIRCFAGDVPICLLVDGDYSTARLEKQYGCQIIRKEDVKDKDLRTRSFGGWGYSKFIPFWEGPFDRFLHLDSDTLMLGNVCGLSAETDADIIISVTPDVTHSHDSITAHWFSPEFVTKLVPGFRIEGQPYFCAGVAFGRKGVFALDEYMNLLELQKANPGRSFQSGDQGIFNFLVFHLSSLGRLKVAERQFQSYPLYMSAEEIREMNSHLADLSEGWKGTPTVLHYIDVKPSLFHEGALRRILQRTGSGWHPAEGWPVALNRFRIRSGRNAGWPVLAAYAEAIVEDLQYHSAAFRKRLGV